jgi:hypothetical protein
MNVNILDRDQECDKLRIYLSLPIPMNVVHHTVASHKKEHAIHRDFVRIDSRLLKNVFQTKRFNVRTKLLLVGFLTSQ